MHRRPLAVALLLALASLPGLPVRDGAPFAPAPARAACGAVTASDTLTGSGQTSVAYSTTRTLAWRATWSSTAWCAPYHFASYNGASWIYLGTGSPALITSAITVGTDGRFGTNWGLGWKPAYKSCTAVSAGAPAGTCGSATGGSFNNTLVVDTVAPAVTLSGPSGPKRGLAYQFAASGADATSGLAQAMSFCFAPSASSTCQTYSPPSIGTGLWAMTFTVPNTWTTLYWRATVRDRAGNTGTASRSWTGL